MNTQRNMTLQSVKSIMNKRTLIPQEAVGKRVKLAIQGNGNTIDVKDKEGKMVASIVDPSLVLQKTIFNTKANSGLAVSNERNRQILKDAVAAEKAKDFEKAHDLYNQYLNATQLSFGILLPSSIIAKLASGVEIAATVEQVTTDNGSLLTIDPSTISIVEPEVYGKTTFDMEAFMDEAEEEVVATAASQTV
jgi:hypothetical protein